MKTDKVKKIYKNIHTKLINEISLLDDSIKLNNTKWRHIDSGGGISCKINGSKYIEKAAINFSSIRGNKLPESALEKSGVQEIRKYNATGVSVIIHPLNPKTACSHLNIRFFEAKHKGGNVWWFGGGFDLTPYFITNGDMLYWKNEARKLCDKYDKSFYNKFNSHCNDYFYLPHRNEPRGIGGIFYDQLNKNDFEFCSSFSLDTANTFIQAYSNLFNKRKDQKFSKKQKRVSII